MTKQLTDPALWTTRPVYGVAGGPLEIVLTEEGMQRAFSVGAQVRRGPPLEAMLQLAMLGGRGALSERNGAKLKPSRLGRFHMQAWCVLEELGYVDRWHDGGVDGMRITPRGELAVRNGYAEQSRLLERCRKQL